MEQKQISDMLTSFRDSKRGGSGVPKKGRGHKVSEAGFRPRQVIIPVSNELQTCVMNPWWFPLLTCTPHKQYTLTPLPYGGTELPRISTLPLALIHSTETVRCLCTKVKLLVAIATCCLTVPSDLQCTSDLGRISHIGLCRPPASCLTRDTLCRPPTPWISGTATMMR